jgi:uncharacterized protein YfcZ (UPF0381/DUF406 family)
MPSVVNVPSFQDFTQLARVRDNGAKEVTLGGSSGGEALKTRGNFMSRLVEIFRPEKAQAQHKAAAEAFVSAIESELSKAHSASSPFHEFDQIADTRRSQVLGSLREQLSSQLEGQSRLTGSDIKSVLNWLNTEARFQVYADTMENAQAVLGDLEIAAENDKVDFSVRYVIDQFEDGKKLDADDQYQLQTFSDAYHGMQTALAEIFNADSGSWGGLNETMADKKRAANKEGKTEEAQGWNDVIQWANDTNRDVNSRMKDLAGVSSKVDSILNHLKQADGAPQKTHAPLERAAVTGSEGRSILKNREATPVDPNAVLVDDGTNDELDVSKFTGANVDEADKKASLARSKADLDGVGPRESGFRVSFAAGREVKTLEEIDQRLQGPAGATQSDPAAAANQPAIKPQPGDYV